MSREVLDQSVSAVMDGEADELELRRVLAAAGEDAAVRERWSRYQLARAVMHKQTVVPGLDLASAVSAAIAAEETAAAVAAPKTSRSSWSQFGRIAVAASVTLAVLAGVRFYNGQDDAALAPQLAQQPTLPQQELRPLVAPQGPAVLASYPVAPTEVQPAAPALEDELLRELPVDAAKSAVEAAGGQAK